MASRSSWARTLSGTSSRRALVENTRRQVWLSSEAHARVGSPPGNHDRRLATCIDLDAITEVDEATYDGWARYQRSKLGDILLAKHFPVEYDHLKAWAVQPGIVLTNLARHLSSCRRRSAGVEESGGGCGECAEPAAVDIR